MKKRTIIITSVLVIVIIGIIIIGFIWKKQNQKKSAIVEVQEKQTPSPLPLPVTPNPEFPTQTQTATLTSPNQTITKPYRLLFDKPLLFLDIDYPKIYIYDFQEGIIKYTNIEDETYKEIFKVFDLKNAFMSEDKTKIVIETDGGFKLLDINKDFLFNLPLSTKKIIFAPEPILYINDNKKSSYLAYFKDNKTTKIRNLGILNPNFEVLKNSILIYEENSPIFSLDLKKPSQLSIFLPEQKNYDILTNKNKNLIFVSFKENNLWQSKIIDLSKKTKYSFSWGTIKEKCTFDDILVCALSSNLEPEDWRMFQPNFDEKIIIYNPKNDEVKEINLEEKFDIVKPKLTPMGIIFWNRLDSKIYLLKID